jgi:hypothetical protein
MTVNANSRAFPKDGQRVIDFPRAAYAEKNECVQDIACVTWIYIGMRRRIIIIIILYYDDVEKEGNISGHGRGSLTTLWVEIGFTVSCVCIFGIYIAGTYYIYIFNIARIS